MSAIIDTAVVDTFMQRNEAYARERFAPGLKIMPSLKTTIIGCVDPRVDPAVLFDLRPGEAAVIRNVGGRIYPSTLQTMGLLGVVARSNGGAIGAGWNLVVLHHTDCGMTDLAAFPELLAEYFEIPAEQLEAKAVSDPVASDGIGTHR